MPTRRISVLSSLSLRKLNERLLQPGAVDAAPEFYCCITTYVVVAETVRSVSNVGNNIEFLYLLYFSITNTTDYPNNVLL